MEVAIGKFIDKFYEGQRVSEMRLLHNLVLFANFTRLTIFFSAWVLLFSTNAFATERPDSFADLAERLSPAVVNISTATLVEGVSDYDLPQFPEGSPFEEFFKEFNQRPGAQRTQSLGSGFITDKT